MKKLLLSSLAIFCAQSLALDATAETAVPQAASTPPNIILILTDDQRYDGLGFVNSRIRTPNLDKMAETGTYFENAMVTTSICSPSRATIATGMYARNHRVVDNNYTDTSELQFFPELLQEQGYQTSFFGKWHFGGNYEDLEPAQGFDRWVELVSDFGQGSYYPVDGMGKTPKINVDGKAVDQTGYITDELTDYVIDWMDQTDKNKPFFVWMSHKGVHSEFEPAPRHVDEYKGVEFPKPATYEDTPENNKGKPRWVQDQRNSWHGADFIYHMSYDLQDSQERYYEALLSIDESVGEIMTWLDKNDLNDNTIVMFTSDNGFMFGEHGLIDKRTAYEESIRVPMLMSGPGVEQGEVVDDVVANVDIAPTLLDYAGVKTPAHYDGASFKPMAEGKEIDWRDSLVYEYYWEYNFPYTPTIFAVRTDEYKYIQPYGIWDTEELYNIKEDPQETNNLIASEDHLSVVIEMRKKLYDQMSDQKGEHNIKYSEVKSEGATFRLATTGKKAADFPERWLREYDADDRYAGLLPDSNKKWLMLKAAPAMLKFRQWRLDS